MSKNETSAHASQVKGIASFIYYTREFDDVHRVKHTRISFQFGIAHVELIPSSDSHLNLLCWMHLDLSYSSFVEITCAKLNHF